MNELTLEIHTGNTHIKMIKDSQLDGSTFFKTHVEGVTNRPLAINTISDLILNDDLSQALVSLHQALTTLKQGGLSSEVKRHLTSGTKESEVSD